MSQHASDELDCRADLVCGRRENAALNLGECPDRFSVGVESLNLRLRKKQSAQVQLHQPYR